MSDKNSILAEIEAVTQEVQDLLRKSGLPLHKDEGDSDEAPSSDDASAAPDDGSPEDSDEISEQAEPEMDEQDPDIEEGVELGDAAEETPEQLSAEAQELSDEELDMLLECLMSEKESRMGSEQPMDDDQGEDDSSDESEDPAEKSMPAEYSKLGKSINRKNKKLKKSLNVLVDVVESLAKKVEALSKPAPSQKIVNKAAPVANLQDVQVLHKSTPASKRLTKSETVDFLEGQLKKGNRMVDSGLMYDVASAKTDEDLHKVQDSIVKKGIELPKL